MEANEEGHNSAQSTNSNNLEAQEAKAHDSAGRLVILWFSEWSLVDDG